MATKKAAKEVFSNKGVSMEQLLEAGAHFGHMVRRWNPKMRKFIWQARGGVHIFDLEKTENSIRDAASYLEKMAAEGKRIVFVGTKRQAKDLVREAAIKAGVGHVTERWLGGMLTNWGQMKARIDRLNGLKADRESGRLNKYIKKERLLLDREIEKLERFFGGLSESKSTPDVLFVVDTHKEKVAVREAKNRKIKVVGIVDSNADPDFVDYPIPMNDDAVGAIKLVVDALADAVAVGRKQFKDKMVVEKKPEAMRVVSNVRKEEPKKEVTKETIKTAKKEAK